MNRAKIYRIRLDVQERSIWIVYTQDVFGYAKRLLKRMPLLKETEDEQPSPSDLAIAYYNFEEYDTAFIVLPKGAGAPLLAHEAIHIVDELMDFFGLEGTEFRAHTVEYIMKHVYKN
jgi:hypothetical protein